MVAKSKRISKPNAFKRNVNLTKKWMGKMQKRGKVRRSDLQKLVKYSKKGTNIGDEKSARLTDDLDELRDQEAMFLDQMAENYGFANDESSSSDEDENFDKKAPESKKIKKEPDDKIPLLEVQYSKANFSTAEDQNDDKSNLKHFLPIKTASGKILKVATQESNVKIEKEEEEENDMKEETSDQDLDDETPVDEPISTSKLFANRAQMVEHFKQEIASKAASIIANPQENTSKLKQLVQMSCGIDLDPLVQITVQKLATASLLEIFMDIIPTYFLRPWSDEEEKQQMKKETKRLHEYEQALLRSYQKYLKSLDNFCKCNIKKKLNKIKLSPKLAETCQILGVKCATRLFSDHYHFNFRVELLNSLVPLMSFKDETIRNLCCESVETVFKNDKLGEASLDVIKLICKFVKNNPSKCHPRMLETFLLLKIKEIEKSDQTSKTKRNLLAKKRKIKMMSRKERKTFKRLKKLDDELAELEAEEKEENVLKFHTRIMNQIFAVYFRILKRERLTSQRNECKLLAPILEGLAKYAHLINVEFFDDLLNSLLNLVLHGALNVTDSLHCVKTAFVILSGDGQSLNIDPYGFYRYVYNVLVKISDEKRIALRKKQLTLAMQCLDDMLNRRRKQVTIGRVAAFVKRLATLASKFTAEEARCILLAIRSYFVVHPRLDCLIDEESVGIGSGFYLPNLDDPDRCNAQTTSIIDDLQKLQSSMNSKIVKRLCVYILNGLPANGVNSLAFDITSKLPWSHLCTDK